MLKRRQAQHDISADNGYIGERKVNIMMEMIKKILRIILRLIPKRWIDILAGYEEYIEGEFDYFPNDEDYH